MMRSRFQHSFARTTWRRWLEKLRQYEEIMEMTELDFLERRLRSLEAQVLELRAPVLRAAAQSGQEELSEVQQGLTQ
jgi:hypothetical protein